MKRGNHLYPAVEHIKLHLYWKKYSRFVISKVVWNGNDMKSSVVSKIFQACLFVSEKRKIKERRIKTIKD